MKLIFFLLPLLLISTPLVFAEVQHGITTDKETLSTNPDGTQKIKLTTVPERIYANGAYLDYLFTNNFLSMQIESQHGSILLDKSTCSFNFYNEGFITDNPLFSDSIVAKMANNGTENWNIITQINDATCETYFDKENISLVSKKYVSNIGLMEYKYILNNGVWKTQLEATNLSTLTNKKFGFTQTINLNRDDIIWGNQTKNLDNFDQTTFNRNFLETNQARVLNLLNGFYFDLDIGFDNLESVFVTNPGVNQSKISFNYFRNASILLPNEKLIVDPTITQSVGGGVANLIDATQHSAGEKLETASAELIGVELDSLDVWLRKSGVPTGSATGRIYNNAGTLQETSTNSIDVATLTGVFAQKSFTFAGTHTLAENDRIVVYYDNGGVDFVTVEKATTDEYDSTNSIFTRFVASAWDDTLTTHELKFIIVYYTVNPPWAVTDLTSTALGQTTATLDWTQPYLGGGNQALIGYQINVTAPQTNNPLVYTNNTGSSNSFVNLSGLTLGTSYSARVSAWTNVTNDHPLNNATGNVYNFTTNTFTPPSAPTLSALSESESSVRFTSVNGTTNDFNMFYYGLRCVENSLGSWVTIVSNSTTPNPRIYSYSLTTGDSVTCQWRDGSFAGFGAWSNNATETTGALGIIQAPRGANDDKLMDFATWIDDEGGLYFGMGVFPMVIMLIGFMATKGTVRIFTLISLMAMGILHGSGYFVYPAWYWALAILFGIVLVLGRQARD